MFFEGKSSELVEKIATENPFGRLGEAKDVVPLVGFLASDGGEWINGQSIRPFLLMVDICKMYGI